MCVCTYKSDGFQTNPSSTNTSKQTPNSIYTFVTATSILFLHFPSLSQKPRAYTDKPKPSTNTMNSVAAVSADLAAIGGAAASVVFICCRAAANTSAAAEAAAASCALCSHGQPGCWPCCCWCCSISWPKELWSSSNLGQSLMQAERPMERLRGPEVVGVLEILRGKEKGIWRDEREFSYGIPLIAQPFCWVPWVSTGFQMRETDVGQRRVHGFSCLWFFSYKENVREREREGTSY